MVPMRERLDQRLAELKAEYRAGQNVLAELDAKQKDLEQTLLRISGAIQVLEEILDTDHQIADPPSPALVVSPS